MKLTSKIYLLFIGCFVPVINYGQQLYKPAHFESPRSMPIQSVPVSKTINVVDYGACPDDNKNDWPAICRALAECERSGGGVRILFPKGIYQIKVGERKSKLTHAFSLSNVSDFIIEGDGAILILENPDVALMTLKNCQAGVIKGLTIDYKTLPFTQGAVVDVDINGKTFTFRSDGKGGRPTDDNFAKSKTKWGVLFDRESNRLLKDKAPNLVPIREVSNLGDKNLFRIVTTQNVIEQIAVDDPFAMIARYNGCSTYSVNQCRQITFLNNIHYAGPAGSFGLRESTGISIVNCKIQQKEDRLISQNADCVHVTPSYEGPWIEGCLFEGQMDDAINIKTELVYILKAISDNQFLVSAKLRVNDELSLFNPREGRLIGTCRVLEAVPMDDATKIKIDARFENLQIGRDKTKDMFFNDSKSNDNFVIKNNVFRNSRRYGMLIQAKNGIIEGNILENLSTGAITLQNSASWPEGFVPRNIVIENNKIRNAGFDRSYWAEGKDIAPILIRTTTVNKKQAEWKGIRNIRIKDNEIISNSDHTIFLSGAQDIVIEKNRNDAQSDAPYYQENCDNVIIK